jgi:hypothetical protein
MLVLILAQLFTPDCVATLRSRGYGAVTAKQVAPYVDCLNTSIGTVEQLRAACLGARTKAADYHGSAALKDKVQNAVNWLDAMTHWRAQCETKLTVDP